MRFAPLCVCFAGLLVAGCHSHPPSRYEDPCCAPNCEPKCEPKCESRCGGEPGLTRLDRRLQWSAEMEGAAVVPSSGTVVVYGPTHSGPASGIIERVEQPGPRGRISVVEPAGHGGMAAPGGGSKMVESGAGEESPVTSLAFIDLSMTFRRLWLDHVVYTREFVIEASAGLPTDAVAKRLEANQDALGKAIGSFYGEQRGARLGQLLKEHISFAVDSVTAAKANQVERKKLADRKLLDNAAAIATLLSEMNPTWKRDDVQDMLEEHVSLLDREATLRLQANYTEDIRNFDRIVDQALSMADAMAFGVRKQFPEKFKK